MKKISTYLLLSALAMLAITPLMAARPLIRDITDEIPEIGISVLPGYSRIPNVAQYKDADWSQVVGIAKGITLEEAKAIADNDPRIDYFFYTKGYQIVLEREDGSYRLFRNGDTVFFTGQPWWGSAPNLADGYIKNYEAIIALE